MTSINAIRFNHYEGACICDEVTTSGGDMRVEVSDKIRPAMPRPIVDRYGTVAAIGTTGSCSTGQAIKDAFSHRVLRHFEAEVDKRGAAPERFLSLRDLAALLFDVIVDLKFDALSDLLRGQHGFSLPELYAGAYRRADERYEIRDKDVIRDIVAMLAWKSQQEVTSAIFNNAALMAGYDEQDGFAIYQFDQRGGGYWHRVHTFYLAEGSGRHSFDPAMFPFAEKLLASERRGEVDRAEGMLMMLHGLNQAAEHEMGVGGYPNILLFNGRCADHAARVVEINDERSLLASHVAHGLQWGFIRHDLACELIDDLLFRDRTWQSVADRLFAAVPDERSFSLALRGYKLLPHRHEIAPPRPSVAERAPYPRN
ncbi:MAG: hypothetical protein HYV63_17380 [Candidatus Schekmanbacteria bacterium]|nr:hypothetical protein [Candidatus Schekmanbacteria bacterium]